MRPQFEHVGSSSEASWVLQDREIQQCAFEWHYHPEYELTLTQDARGQRFVGDCVADFGPCDLVLIGPNLPHAWSLHGQHGQTLTVAWFSQAWLDRLVEGFPELQCLARLGQSAAQGLAFPPPLAEALAPAIVGLHDLPGARRLPALLDILIRLAEAASPRPIASSQFGGGLMVDARNERLARVLELLHANIAAPVEIEALAERAALSVGAFQRFFRRQMRRTVTAYVAELRIGRACQQLIETDKPIGLIAAEVGYANLAHFNRQFRAIRATTPSAFRTLYRQG
ncbi:helix-turn-helix domain-containing protein [Niveibacterium terrae]|uniref:helix-turn-helix domain-containing protein n=1 Tax=Niveibacterium terrae TaxID=3373598 RepID=UPI003A8CC6A6